MKSIGFPWFSPPVVVSGTCLDATGADRKGPPHSNLPMFLGTHWNILKLPQKNISIMSHQWSWYIFAECYSQSSWEENGFWWAPQPLALCHAQCLARAQHCLRKRRSCATKIWSGGPCECWNWPCGISYGEAWISWIRKLNEKRNEVSINWCSPKWTKISKMDGL